MKTRKVHTKIWLDDWFCGLSLESKLLFVYLITNQYIGISGTYELSTRVILFETGLTQKQFDKAISDLFPKVLAYNGWISVVNAESYDPIRGDNNTLWKTRNKEVEDIPQDIKDHFDKCPINAPSMGDSPSIDGRKGIGIGIGNIDRESVREEERKYKNREDVTELDFQEIFDKYQFPLSFIRSKFDDVCNWEDEKPGRMRGRNWKLTLINWCKRDFIKMKQGGNNGRRVAVIPLE